MNKKLTRIAAICFVLCMTIVFVACAPEQPNTDPDADPATVVSITLGGTARLRYRAGENFDPTGLVVTAHYSDGTKKAIDDYDITPSADTVLRTSHKTLTVSYGDFCAEKHLSVVAGDGKGDDAIKADFAANKRTAAYDGYSVNYIVRDPDYTPSASDPAPLVLFLHGSGERGTDNAAQLKNSILHGYDELSSMFYDSYVIAPQCPYRATEDGEDLPKTDDRSDYTKWVNRDWKEGNYNLADITETKALNTVAKLVEEYAAKPEVDASRIYVMGVSMGGYGAWDIIARHGELFAGAVVMCGGGPIDKATELADIPVYIFHGTADNSVPYDKTAPRMYDALKEKNKGKTIFKSFDGQGHMIWDLIWADDLGNDIDGKACPKVADWLFVQSK